MVKLPEQLLAQLQAAAGTTLTSYLILKGFEATLDQGKLGFRYDEDISPNMDFGDGRDLYLRKINNAGRMTYFLAQFLDKYGENAVVGDLKQALDDFYENLLHLLGNDAAGADLIRIKKQFFDCSLIGKNKLPFIDRKNVKENIYDLVHERTEGYLLINGESGSGLSYTSYYLSQVGEITNSFKVFTVDLDKIFKRVRGMVKLSHIAKEMLKITDFELPFSLDNDEHFKYEEFIGAFYKFLDQCPFKYLFFFDHFNVAHSEEVRLFINELVDDRLSRKVENCYVVLAGYDGFQDWDFEVQVSATNVKIESFREEQLLDYAKRLYEHLSGEFELEFSEDAFIDLLKEHQPFFDPGLFDPGTPEQPTKPNVTFIGRGVFKWFVNFQKQIAQTA